MPKLKLFFAGLCMATLAALIYFAEAAATQSAPPYSTWNTQPNGAKLLFDGLQQAGFVQVFRQFKPLNIEKPQSSTVFFLGIDAFNFEAEDAGYFDAMEAAAKRANDLVIAVFDEPEYAIKSQGEKTELGSRWGIRFVSDKGVLTTYPIVDKSWKPLPGLSDVWQRNFGTGSIILIAKGQRLSNKSVATNAADRQLLYRLVSLHATAIFEEAHLGIQESGSVVGLARHYHLQGLMLGFILLAGMFVWSRSVSFPPPMPMPEKVLIGSDTRSMLTELMLRHLKGQEISSCVAEWNRTRGHSKALTVPADKHSVAAYRQLQESLQNQSKYTL